MLGVPGAPPPEALLPLLLCVCPAAPATPATGGPSLLWELLPAPLLLLSLFLTLDFASHMKIREALRLSERLLFPSQMNPLPGTGPVPSHLSGASCGPLLSRAISFSLLVDALHQHPVYSTITGLRSIFLGPHTLSLWLPPSQQPPALTSLGFGCRHLMPGTPSCGGHLRAPCAKSRVCFVSWLT